MITRTGGRGRDRKPVPFVPALSRCFLWEKSGSRNGQVMFQGAQEWEAVYRRSFKAQVIFTMEKVETNWPYEGLLCGFFKLPYSS